MTATKHTFRLLSDVISVDRIHDGEFLPTDIVVGWADVAPGVLPTLTIHQRWSEKQGRWLETTSYFVAEIAVGNGFDGRGFRLVKQELDADGEPIVPLEPEIYDTFVCRHNANNICDCKGFGRHGHCKHNDAMRFVITRGLMDVAADTLPDVPLPMEGDPFAGIELQPQTRRAVQPGELEFI